MRTSKWRLVSPKEDVLEMIADTSGSNLITIRGDRKKKRNMWF
jgi:hypothetical protein